MNKNLLTIILLIMAVFALISSANGVIRNPAIKSPVGPGTVPPSSYKSGLIPSVNPIDRTSDLVVTGNISGGKHFRGVVPYNAITNFGGTLGSTTLDSFMRRTSGLGWTKPTPYYSQTATVTTTTPGSRGVQKPPTTKIDTGSFGESFLPSLTMKQLPQRQRYNQTLATDNVNYLRQKPFSTRVRPMANRPQQLEKALLNESQLNIYRRQKQSEAEYNKQREQFQLDIKKVNDKAEKLKQSLIAEYQPTQLADEQKPGSDFSKSFKQVGPDQQLEDEKYEQNTVDVYEQMKKKIDDLYQSKIPAYLSDSEQLTGQTINKDKKTQELKSEQQKQKLMEVDLASAKAKAVLGEHKTFASFSEDKFNQYLRAGENYLKEGKYYRAADAYTMASVYKPKDPLAYAGKSQALLAAGEYMSSSLFLSRTLDIFPEYAMFKIDIVTMVGDRDKLESRIVDIEQWLKQNNAGELQFLLAYVYYQLDRLDRAAKAIDIAYGKMPDSHAVSVLKSAIDNAMKAAQR